MLSNESEHFLLQLRMELMSKGKKDKDIEAIEEELRDHLYEAESRGESIDSITGGSVKSYIDSLSKEMPFDTSMIWFGFLMVVSCICFFTVPRMIAGIADLSVESVIYYGILMFFIAPLELWSLKNIIVKYGDKRKTYILTGIVAISLLVFCLIGEFLLRNINQHELVSLNSHVSFYFGIGIAALFILICVLVKYWFFVGVMVYIILPELIAKLFVSDDPKSEEYVTASGITWTVLNVIAGTLFILYTRRQMKENP